MSSTTGNESCLTKVDQLFQSLKTPQPWPDKQDEQLREAFLHELSQLLNQPDVDIWFADESGFEGDPRPRKRYVCKNEEQLIERLDQAILDVINNPKKTQRTADFGTLF